MGAIQQSILGMIGSTTQAVGINKMIQNQNQANNLQQAKNRVEAIGYKKQLVDTEQELKDLDNAANTEKENITPDDQQLYDDYKEAGYTPSDFMDKETVRAIEALKDMSAKRDVLVDQKSAVQALYDALKSEDTPKANIGSKIASSVKNVNDTKRSVNQSTSADMKGKYDESKGKEKPKPKEDKEEISYADKYRQQLAAAQARVNKAMKGDK